MIRILIADDHSIVAQGMASILSEENDLKVVGQAANGKQALDFLQTNAHECDLLILDMNMPEMDGEQVAVEVRERFPAIKILVMSMVDNGLLIENMLKAGVHGYVLKNISQVNLIQAIREVHSGGEYFSAEVTKKIVRRMRGQKDKGSQLTKRELEVLRLMGEGLRTSEIADQLFVSQNTVKTHRKSLLSKAKVNNALELVKWARQQEFIL